MVYCHIQIYIYIYIYPTCPTSTIDPTSLPDLLPPTTSHKGHIVLHRGNEGTDLISTTTRGNIPGPDSSTRLTAMDHPTGPTSKAITGVPAEHRFSPAREEELHVEKATPRSNMSTNMTPLSGPTSIAYWRECSKSTFGILQQAQGVPTRTTTPSTDKHAPTGDGGHPTTSHTLGPEGILAGEPRNVSKQFPAGSTEPSGRSCEYSHADGCNNILPA